MIRLPITSARCTLYDGHRWLELTVGGHVWQMDPQKATLLQAHVLPLPPELAQYGEPLVEMTSAATEEDAEHVIENATQDPVALELARRLWAGYLEPGPVEIPPLEVAEAARWQIDPTAGIFRPA